MEYTEYESQRLAKIMADDPKSAAAEMRDQLSQLPRNEAIDLIRSTKEQVIPGGAGDLIIQAETDPNGCDTGYRNVTMATPDGPEQIAEIRVAPQPCGPDGAYDDGYGDGRQIDPLAAAAGIIIGGIMAHRNYEQYRYGNPMEERAFMERQWRRENGWENGRDEFRRQWQNPDWRQQQQGQQYFWGQPGQMIPRQNGNQYGRPPYGHGMPDGRMNTNPGRFYPPNDMDPRRGGGIMPDMPIDPRRLIPGLGGAQPRRDYDYDRRDPRMGDPRFDPRMQQGDPRLQGRDPRMQDPRFDPRMQQGDPRLQGRDPRMQDLRLDPRMQQGDPRLQGRDPRMQDPRFDPRQQQGDPRLQGRDPRMQDPRFDPRQQQGDPRMQQRDPRLDQSHIPRAVTPGIEIKPAMPPRPPIERAPAPAAPPARVFAPPAQPAQRPIERHAPPAQVDPRLQQQHK